MHTHHFLMGSLLAVSLVLGQTATTNQTAAPTTPTSESSDGTQLKGITPSPLTVQHSLSFGMATGFGSSSLQSQGFYNTMMQYRFSAPVTLNLNFGLPIYSTNSPYQNPSAKSIQSLDYFKSMPFDVGLSWKPNDHMNFNLMVVNRPYSPYGMSNYGMFPWR